MESSDGSSEHTIHRHMMNLKTADDEDPHLNSIPPDVQKLIFSYLDSEVLLQMRAANIYYRDKISNDCQDIWNSQIAIIWMYGKGMLNENNMEFIKWSQENNFNVHRVNTEITGFEEFFRRRRLDHTVFERLINIDFGSKGEDRRVVVGGMVRRMKGLDESADNHNWVTLMEDGEDIIDCLEHTQAIAYVSNFTENDSQYVERCSKLQSLRTFNETINYYRSKRESICHRSGCDTKQVMIKCQRALNGIYRLHAYQQWKFLQAKKAAAHPIEAGASVIAKFYLTIFRTIRAYRQDSSNPYIFDNTVDDIDIRLCELAEDIKSGLEKRLGQCSSFPLLEVVQEMQSLFGNDSPFKFRGNTTNYYDPNNSLLHEVLARKTGIPITLAIVYAAIVRRVCGAHLDLIGLPGHIVIGLPFEEGVTYAERVYVDVFHGGTHLSHSDLKSIVAQYGLAWNDEMAKPISHQQVWERMIRNLMHCHSDVSMLDNDNVRVLMTLQSLIDPAMRIETFQEMILAPGFSAYTC